MPKLILSMDGLVLKEIPLNKERTTIGRKPHNDIQIDNLAISGEHAVITAILDDAFLEDRNSTNGTYVNGQPVKKCALQNNDVVELGKYRIKFVVDAVAASGPLTDFVDTAALKPVMADPEVDVSESDVGATNTVVGGDDAIAAIDAEATQILDRAGAGVAAERAASPAKAAAPAPSGEGAGGMIQVLSGPNVGRELELTKSLTTLGKPGVQVAVITRRPHGYFITHVEGSTFPVVNGSPLGAQAHHLSDHDIIEIAGVKMEFFLRNTA
ncbi:FHA domain-containing protein [Denitromonas ohlonensis]|jgi:pSer/pThr/pTyr-binding forkhead associated (FHA) protein|uniref:FHA domain-containing protein n=2 Tax=Denitromonas TaxID=139331 RepID=A0A558CG45_9RHOO|nr:FHA domain-containing protein [Denitromonas ohlonensis]TVT47743.1 MAG: FHA domain-containing protein [Denitromonas halophila]TVO62489.1 FHA domain-containing protein [Denitromonas ohlonensis]TVO72343.1 FHA domain-containing protein [Denitromonas ohlonensis]TVT68402.1 MAG: FHA domain-containing protein [Denitromonas halophila]TVT77760.1 MAG: FHA domain-containing protein [Denitromonas halophila]